MVKYMCDGCSFPLALLAPGLKIGGESKEVEQEIVANTISVQTHADAMLRA